jgi:hypothetical protein
VPTILFIRGYRFYFFAEEGNEPPHVHIEKGAGSIKVWLDDTSIMKSENLKPPEIRAALQLTRKYRSLLLNSWHEWQKRKG